MAALIDVLERVGKNSGGIYMHPQPRRGMNRAEAAAYIGVSIGTFDKLVSEKAMPDPIRIRSRVIWDLHALDAAFDALVTPSSDSSWDRMGV